MADLIAGKQSPGNAAASPDLMESLRLLQAEGIAFASRTIQDGKARARYIKEIQKASDEILQKVQSNVMTAEAGATEANLLRNSIMDVARMSSSDLGQVLASFEKSQGLTINPLLKKYSALLYKQNFSELTVAKQNQVYLEIIRAAGRANPFYTRLAQGLSVLGKRIVFVSVAFATYNIVTSKRPGREFVHQAGTVGAGFWGAALGTAAGGWVCGPEAPVCAGVGFIVGGLGFALGFDASFDRLWE